MGPITLRSYTTGRCGAPFSPQHRVQCSLFLRRFSFGFDFGYGCSALLLAKLRPRHSIKSVLWGVVWYTVRRAWFGKATDFTHTCTGISIGSFIFKVIKLFNTPSYSLIPSQGDEIRRLYECAATLEHPSCDRRSFARSAAGLDHPPFRFPFVLSVRSFVRSVCCPFAFTRSFGR